jgi:hyperosmotically inducible periplasmic protein
MKYVKNTSAIYKALSATALLACVHFSSANAADSRMMLAAASAPEAKSDGIGATLSDTAITAQIKAKLLTDDGLKKSKIDVTTTNGVVTLEGSASSSTAKSLAETLTKAVDGVKSVDNTLKTPDSNKTADKAKREVSDSWITTKVKSAILADSVTKGFDVSVETTKGVVVLKGQLASEDAVDHVKDIAAKIEGVKSVDTAGVRVKTM